MSRPTAVVLLLALALLGGLLLGGREEGPDPAGRRPVGVQAPAEPLEGRDRPLLSGREGDAPRAPRPAPPGADEAQAPPTPESRPRLRVEAVEAATGRARECRWVAAGALHRALRDAGLDDRSPAFLSRLPLEEPALAESLLERSGVSVPWPRGHGVRTPVLRGGFDGEPSADLGLLVWPPQGLVPAPSPDRSSRAVQAGTREARLVVPLLPARTLTLRVRRADGQPAPDAVVVGLEVVGQRWGAPTETLGPGLLALTGLPHLPGAPVSVRVGGAGRPPCELRTAVPAELEGPWEAELRLEGRTSWPGGDDLPEDYVDRDSAFGRLHAPSRPGGTLHLRLRGWDGSGESPLRWRAQRDEGPDGSRTVWVWDGPEGAELEGDTLTLRDREPGEHELVIEAPGRLPFRGRLSVREGQATEATLTEPRGAALVVGVVDASGRPLPAAQLRLGARWFDAGDDGGDRLDLFIDASGRRRIERVEPGDHRLSARWGALEGTAELRLADGEERPLTLVLR